MRGVPIVALHRLAVGGDHRAADVVRAALVAARKTVRIGVHKFRFAHADRRALAVVDALIDRKACIFTALGDSNGRVCLQCPRVIKIKLGNICRHRGRVGQPGMRIGTGEFRNAQRFVDCRIDRSRRKVAGAGVALAAVDIHRHAERFIDVVLQRFQLTEPYRHIEPNALCGLRFGLIGTAAFGAVKGCERNVAKSIRRQG